MDQRDNMNDLEDVNGLDYRQDETMTPEEEDIVAYVNKRWERMKTHREDYEQDWKDDEDAMKADVAPSTDGKAVINMPMEQNNTELYLGQIDNILNYKVDPEGRCDPSELIISKYVLDHFVKKEGVIKQFKIWDYMSAQKGLAWLFSGLWFENKRIFEPKGEVEGLFAEEYNEKLLTIWHIGVKYIPVERVWWDEVATHIDEAMDEIYEEKISIEEFRMRYLDDKGKPIKPFKYINSVQTGGSDTVVAESAEDKESSDRLISVCHYYNVFTGSYYIIGDAKWLMLKAKMTALHGKLPFRPRQFYPNPGHIPGISLPKKLASVKPYVNNFLKAGLDAMWNSVSPILMMGNNANLDGENFYDPGSLNIWSFTGDLKNDVREMQFQANINGIVSIIQLIEDYGIQNTGFNIKSAYSTPTGTAFEAGIMQQEQNKRMKALFMERDECVEEVLTMMLSNIRQYGPYKLAEQIFNEEGEKNYKPYQIRVDGKKIKKNGSKVEFEDAPGDYDWFDFEPDTIVEGLGMKVRIDTPTTKTGLAVLEKDDYNQALQALIQIKQLFPEANIGDGNDWVKKLQMIYGFDIEQLYIKSIGQKNAAKTAQLMETIQQMGDETDLPELPTIPNAQPNNEANQQTQTERVPEMAGAISGSQAGTNGI